MKDDFLLGKGLFIHFNVRRVTCGLNWETRLRPPNIYKPKELDGWGTAKTDMWGAKFASCTNLSGTFDLDLIVVSVEHPPKKSEASNLTKAGFKQVAFVVLHG